MSDSFKVPIRFLQFMTLLMVFVPFLVQGASSNWWRRSLQSESSLKIDVLNQLPTTQLAIPVLFGVEVSNLTRNFGDPRSGGRLHEGLDIMAPLGTPVVSPTDAVVISTGNGSSAGLYVQTANPGGETFVYMHLSEIAKGIQRGMILSRGDVLGFVGNTGNASGGATHLHFEIRKNGAADPFPRLTSVFTPEERIIFNTASSSVSITTNKTGGITENENPTISDFSRDITLGATGEDVRLLQIFLNSQGFIVSIAGAGSPGNESLYFGKLTRSALARYQAYHSISPSVGYFGPITRTSINLLL